MDIGKRLQRYAFKPMMIHDLTGLMSLIAYLDEMSIGLSDDILLAKYRETKEAQKTAYYSATESPILLAGERLEQSTKQNQKQIAILNLSGTMSVSGGLCTDGIDVLCNRVAMAKANPNVIGAVLKTHCGGGEALAAQRLGIALDSFRAEKPIVMYGDFVASGAYLAGAKCNEIVAGGAMSEFGSIGVVIQLNKEIIDYIKENVISIYADGSEDKHADLKAILEEKYDVLRNKSLNPIRTEFVKIVKDGRKNIDKTALTGDMFMAKEAKKLGLINAIGDLDFAMKRVITLKRRYNTINNAKKIQNNYV